MSIKQQIRMTLRKMGFDVHRIYEHSDAELEQVFINGGKIPWSSGYLQSRNRFISDILNNSRWLGIFRQGSKLPDEFGIGYDERCIELSWLFANLPDENKRVLDAGSIMNHQFLVNHPLLRKTKLHILTLSPEKYCFWQKGISYLYDDLRKIPIRDQYYDIVICISTLEHVGFNNSMYTHNDNYQENKPDDFVLAINEIRRVLKPGGTLFLTLPFGSYQNLGWSQQFDRELLTRAITAFEPDKVVETFYQYTSKGWQLSTAQECKDSKYVQWIAQAWLSDKMPDSIPVEADKAAAARAVACVKLVRK